MGCVFNQTGIEERKRLTLTLIRGILLGMKTCKKCNQLKPLDQFSIRSDSGKPRSECKECMILWQSNYARNNRERFNSNAKVWRTKNKEKYRAIQRKYKAKERSLERERRYQARTRKTVEGCLNHRVSTAILASIKKNKGGRSWEQLVGYSLTELKSHLQMLFIDGMSWAKLLSGDIHIDHIIPKSLFKYSAAEDSEFKQCWCLANLQPLWKEDNLKKWKNV